jgi:chromosome segregation ATPase
LHELLLARFKEIEELRKENSILKISNLNELNTNILTLEQRVADANAERDKFKAKVELKETRIRTLEAELDVIRAQVEHEQEEREVTHDINKDNLKLKIEKDQLKAMLDKALIKLDKRKQILDQQENDIKSLKDERFRLEEKIRMLMRENIDEHDRFNREREDKMRIQTEIHDLSNRITCLLKDNQTLEANLEEFKKRPSNSDSTCANSETDLKLQIKLIEY